MFHLIFNNNSSNILLSNKYLNSLKTPKQTLFLLLRDKKTYKLLISRF